MKRYDVVCSVCGTVNKDVYLEETNGLMECEKCHSTIKVQEFDQTVLVPVYSMKNFHKVLNSL